LIAGLEAGGFARCFDGRLCVGHSRKGVRAGQRLKRRGQSQGFCPFPAKTGITGRDLKARSRCSADGYSIGQRTRPERALRSSQTPPA
jgi:hypothetical protein